MGDQIESECKEISKRNRELRGLLSGATDCDEDIHTLRTRRKSYPNPAEKQSPATRAEVEGQCTFRVPTERSLQEKILSIAEQLRCELTEYEAYEELEDESVDGDDEGRAISDDEESDHEELGESSRQKILDAIDSLKYQIGDESGSSRFSIALLGQNGAGKSTLINLGLQVQRYEARIFFVRT